MGKKISLINMGKTLLILAFLAGLPVMVFPYESVCPRLKLNNGRIRYRFRTRNVRFNCMRGFQLVGAKYASCMNGKWDAPTPICVKYGCRVPSTTHVNGQFIESYRGAVVKIICNPGYSLVGSPSVYCNGVKWNETFPVCSVFNKNPALSCDFESEDMCGWSQDPMQDFHWKKMDLKSPPPGEVGGPPTDHTLGLTNSGVYMFMGSFDPRSENETVRLFSPVYPPEVSNGTCFKFWYYMPEGNMDTLKVYVKPEGVELYDIIPSFWMSGDQGRNWVLGYFSIYPVETRFQIVIEGIKGAYYASDTGFDDVEIASGYDCPTAEGTTTSEYPTTGDQFDDQEDIYSGLSCRNRCNQALNRTSTSIPVTSSQVPAEEYNSGKCGCQEECVRAKTCCSDFFNFCQFSDSTTVESTTDNFTMTIPNEPNDLPTRPEINEFGSSPSPPKDHNKEDNNIDPEKPIVVIPKVYLPEKPQIKPEVGQGNTAKSSTLPATTPSARSKTEKITIRMSSTVSTERNRNATVKMEKTKSWQVIPPAKKTNVSQTTKSIGIKPEIPGKPKLDFKQPKVEPDRVKSFRGKNVTVEMTDRNRKENEGKNFPVVTSSSTTAVSPRRPPKIEKEKLPSNSSLWKKVKVTQPKINDVTFQATKSKEFSGKEPPQAIKIDAGDDSRKGVVQQVLEIGGICSVLLVVTIALGIVFYRRNRNRKLERNNMVEDSDVRFLTSDEVLDFTLAHPADDDL